MEGILKRLTRADIGLFEENPTQGSQDISMFQEDTFRDASGR